MTDTPKGEEEAKVTSIKALIERIEAWHNKHGGPRDVAASKLLIQAKYAMEKLIAIQQVSDEGYRKLMAELAEEKRKVTQLEASLAEEKNRREEKCNHKYIFSPADSELMIRELKAKYEAEHRLYSATREVAIEISIEKIEAQYHPISPEDLFRRTAEFVDNKIEAKRKG